MSSEIFINYWIGQEPNPPSPTLDQMPAYVNIVPLAFVGIATDSENNYVLDFGFLTQHFPASQIQGWIRTVQANGTKVLLSILDEKLGTIEGDQLAPFVANVAQNVADWGVDGIDFDYEPPNQSDTLVPLIEAIRAALPAGSVFTAPVYGPWAGMPDMLKGLAGAVDYVTTMDYTPYPGYESTISNCSQYAEIMGGWAKLVIGISCMGPATDQDWGNFTPFADVSRLSAYEPSATESKGGAMLYTFSYDVETRKGSGTGYPDGTWTETIHANLP